MYILDGCGSIPQEITDTIGSVYNILLVAIPVVVVLFGLIDLLKAVISKKDDEIKQSTNLLIKRVITALIAFFVLAIVKFGLDLLQTNNTSDAISCLNSITGNK